MPRCGHEVIERAMSYLCVNVECKFTIWKEINLNMKSKVVFTRVYTNTTLARYWCRALKRGVMYTTYYTNKLPFVINVASC